LKKIEAGDYTVKAVKMRENSWGVSLEGNLYYMNKKIATFEDQGNGGPLNVWYEESDYDNQDTLKQYLEVEHDYGDFEPIEQFINDLSVEYEHKKMVRRDRKKLVYFGAKDDPEGQAQRFVRAPYSYKVAKYLYKTYPDNIEYIANELYDIYPDGENKVVEV